MQGASNNQSLPATFWLLFRKIIKLHTQQHDKRLVIGPWEQWRSQEIVRGGANPGGLRDRSPPLGSKGEAPVGVSGRSPQTLTTLL